ncbi:MAG TPA: HypC/HybG/HupF family hydrogenase formation chaperone [Candidatus Udaeobacter sp.]
MEASIAMNLAYGEIVDVEIEDGVQLGKIRVLGAIKKVPLDLVEDVKKGDRVLLCDGVAIPKARRRRQPSIS